MGRMQQLTEQFSKAIEQLGHSSTDVRLGGLYTLERLLSEDQLDAGPIVEIIVAYINSHAPLGEDENYNDIPFLERGDISRLHVRAPDVQAALTILGRRRRSPAFSYKLMLTRVDLEGGILADGDFRNFSFIRANLKRVSCQRANFEGATFAICNLERAALFMAKFMNARLVGVNLTDAEDLHTVDLQGAETDNESTWPEGFDMASAGVSLQQSNVQPVVDSAGGAATPEA